MTQIGILNGIFTDTDPAFRHAYPINCVPVPKSTGISSGYLRPGDGLVKFGDAVGLDRGGIDWRGILYRVQGSKFVSIDADGAVTVIGDVGDDGEPVTMVHSFDYLAIASNQQLWLYDEIELRRNVDPDLGIVISVAFLDGYFVCTDGEFLVVTELGDPFSVNPFKYGSSELDPDPIVAVLELRNEIYAVNTNTIEVFDNVGGEGFPLARIPGAAIEKGAVRTFATHVFENTIAFVGNGLNEAIAVYEGLSGQTSKISTAEIDELLAEDDLSNIFIEDRIDRHHQYLYVHLSDKTLVYDRSASRVTGEPVWFILDSNGRYKARRFIRIYGKWVFGDPTSSRTGYTVENISTHYGEQISWVFGTSIIYNESNGAIIHELELVTLGGQVAVGTDPVIATEWSADGLTWSVPKTVKLGTTGDRNRRIRWFKQGRLRDKRMQRFRGTSDAHATFARLEARIEGLAW